MMSLTFGWAWCFLALPLPWLFGKDNPPHAAGALRLPRLPAYASGGAGKALSRARWLSGLLWLLLVTAAARPQLPGQAIEQPLSGHSLMLAFDISASMGTRDLHFSGRAIDRLSAARILADGFLERNGGSRAGLIVFGSQAFLHTPLTLDMNALRNALATAEIGLAGKETALGDAIALATRHLRGQASTSRSLIIVTDGANNSGQLTPRQAAWLARREGVRIHALHLGDSRQPDEREEETLRDIAEQTGGSYRRAADSRSLAGFWQELAETEAMHQGQRVVYPRQELYHWPLALALLLALLPLIGRRRGMHT